MFQLTKQDNENGVPTPPKKELLRFAKLTDQAFPPTRGSPKAAGFDLYSAYDYVVPAKGFVSQYTFDYYKSVYCKLISSDLYEVLYLKNEDS